MSAITHPLVVRAAATDEFTSDCPARELLAQLGSKWTPLVMIALAQKPHHFGELARRLQGVSKKVLVETLRSLERSHILTRETTTSGAVVKVRYALTDQGRTLVEPLFAVYTWVEQHAVGPDAFVVDAPAHSPQKDLRSQADASPEG